MSTERHVSACVVGAGAAGLWAAERAARAGASVVCLEKTPRTGTKVLASGGTRCNLTTTLEPADALPWFGPAGGRFLREAVWNLPSRAIRDRFHALGVPTVEAPLEKVFPASDRARDVRDALENAAREAGVAFCLDHPVLGIEREEPYWRLALADGACVRAEKLVLAPGGKSYPRSGTTGDGYNWLEDLGLPCVAPVPALVPLRSSASWVHALTGIALPHAELRAVSPSGRSFERRRRPVLFTHSGLSGPGAMDLSGRIARALEQDPHGEPWTIAIDLLPDVERAELRERLVQAASDPGAPRLSRAAGIELPKRLWRALARLVDPDSAEPIADPPLNRLTKAQRHAWIECLKGVPVPIDGTLGFDKAEVTAGGLDLKAVDPRTMRVRGLPDLWACGELLDLQGPIGGFSFLSAWATAELAGIDCARTA